MSEEPEATSAATATSTAATPTPTVPEIKSEQDAKRRKMGYKEVPMTNAQLEEYYKNVGVIPASEWDAFLTAMRTPLPTTFRVTSNHYLSGAILARLKELAAGLPADLRGESGQALERPRPIEWYPNGEAWYMNVGKKDLRKSPGLAEFYRFVAAQNEQGGITRQEAVSMIPPLMMDVRPESRVLDVCAAPGSKTTELLELLHSKIKSPGLLPSGFVVANDVDVDRSFMLVHQTKRMASPCFVVTCHEGESYPKRAPNGVPFDFDRILCDVPCSGDGTLRKNVDAWRRWTPFMGLRQHKVQARIAQRGVYLLRNGGRLVYSTCSLNPVEDEAVVAEVLRSSKGTMRLVDVSGVIPGLKRSPGISSWKVYTGRKDAAKDGKRGKEGSESSEGSEESGAGCWYTSHAELPPQLRKTILPSVFPPTAEEAAEFHLERCLRVLPHVQDTGGFFVAVLEKIAPSDSIDALEAAKDAAAAAEEEQQKQQQQEKEVEVENKEKDKEKQKPKLSAEEKEKRMRERKVARMRGKENNEPLVAVATLPEQQGTLATIRDFYGIDAGFPVEQLITRNKDASRMLFVSRGVHELIEGVPEGGSKIVHVGLKLLQNQKQRHEVGCNYRFSMEALAWVVPHLHKRVVQIAMDDFKVLLTNENPLFSDFATEEARTAIAAIEPGCFVAAVRDIPHMALSAWRGSDNCHLLVPKEDITSLRNLFVPDAPVPPPGPHNRLQKKKKK